MKETSNLIHHFRSILCIVIVARQFHFNALKDIVGSGNRRQQATLGNDDVKALIHGLFCSSAFLSGKMNWNP